MSNSHRITDSGISSVESFYKGFVDQLGSKGATPLEDDEIDEIADISIDLNDERYLNDKMALASIEPTRKPTNTMVQSTPTSKLASQSVSMDDRAGSSTIQELILIMKQLQCKSSYGIKLANIMAKGLERTLGPETYKLFLNKRMPPLWIPIVKMNEDNTPYVEFLIKSYASDETPEEQLNQTDSNFLSFSKLIADSVPEILSQQKKQQPQLKQSQPLRPQPQLTSTPIQSKSVPKQPNTRTKPPIKQPIEISQPVQPKKRSTTNEIAETSMRENPPRACKRGKTNTTYKL